MNYSIGDFLIRIKNSYGANKKTMVSPSSNYRVAVAELLQKYGYIKGYSVDGDIKKELTLKLDYKMGQPVLTDLKLLTKPGRRLYSTHINLPWGQTPNSLIIVSTSAGVMSQKEATSKKLGGELIAELW